MKFCTQCGSKIDDDSNFCINCGHEIITRTKKSNAEPYKNNIYIVLISILFVLSICFTVWHFGLLQNDTKQSIKDDASSSSNKVYTKEDLPDKKKFSMKNVQEKADNLSKTIFGSDQEVENLNNISKPLSKSLKDIDIAKNYNYNQENCTDQFTDVAQHIGHSIQTEIVKVTKISEQEENNIGRNLAKMMEEQTFKGKIDKNKTWLAYVKKVGNKLVENVNRKGINYNFHVIDNDLINAFALPGGNIYICKGILKKINNEAQLAGILAHEIKHVDLRHCIAIFQIIGRLPGAAQNPMSYQLAQLLRHPYNSRTEAEADRRGLDLIYLVKYSPYQVVKFWENMDYGNKANNNNTGGIFSEILGNIVEEVENLLLTHPKYPKRICLLKNHIVKLQEKYPCDRFYVGNWNYNNKTSMFDLSK